MSTILDQIVQKNRLHLQRSPDYRKDLDFIISERVRRHSFAEALSLESFNVIAELKKASPSKGLIRKDFNAITLATTFEYNGAAALSVLTEPFYFRGSLVNLQLTSAVTDIPILRKDFIFDEIQIIEAVAFGADAILLIAAMLEPARLKQLLNFAHENGLDVLCEVHDENELATVLDAGAKIIGINCRNLKTFEVDRLLTMKMLREIPDDKIKVAESGISNGEEMAELRHAGANAFLIGETLMRSPAPGVMLKKLLDDAKEAFQ